MLLSVFSALCLITQATDVDDLIQNNVDDLIQNDVDDLIQKSHTFTQGLRSKTQFSHSDEQCKVKALALCLQNMQNLPPNLPPVENLNQLKNDISMFYRNKETKTDFVVNYIVNRETRNMMILEFEKEIVGNQVSKYRDWVLGFSEGTLVKIPKDKSNKALYTPAPASAAKIILPSLDGWKAEYKGGQAAFEKAVKDRIWVMYKNDEYRQWQVDNPNEDNTKPVDHEKEKWLEAAKKQTDRNVEDIFDNQFAQGGALHHLETTKDLISFFQLLDENSGNFYDGRGFGSFVFRYWGITNGKRMIYRRHLDEMKKIGESSFLQELKENFVKTRNNMNDCSGNDDSDWATIEQEVQYNLQAQIPLETFHTMLTCFEKITKQYRFLPPMFGQEQQKLNELTEEMKTCRDDKQSEDWKGPVWGPDNTLLFYGL